MEAEWTMTNWRARLKALYWKANKLSGGALEVLRQAWRAFQRDRGAEAAASIAYYTFFSLFPFLLLFIGIASFVLERQEAYLESIRLINQVLPVSRSLVENTLQEILQLRGSISLVGLVGALWSASNAFTVLARNVNEAWEGTRARTFFQKRLLGLAMAGGLVGLLFLVLAATTIAGFLPRLVIPVDDTIPFHATRWWRIGSQALPFVLTMLVLTFLYHWIPRVDVPWKASFWGALVATIGWELVTGLFTWYLNSGLSRYTVIYGSLNTVVVLMFWIYLTGLIILLGAYVSASAARFQNLASEAQSP
jgi:membrane protein